MFRRIIYIAFLVLGLLGNVQAANLYVATGGSDAGLCTSPTPCATIERACNLANASADQVISISIAGGTYSGGGCSVLYYRFVAVFGDCNNPADIVLSGGDFAFFAQDHAVLTVQCVGVRSFGTGSIAFIARQFSIMDVNYVNIGRLYGGYGMSAQEISKINCGAPLTVSGEAQAVVAVGDKSTVNLGCAVTITGNPAFYAFAVASQGGLLNAATTFSGTMSGLKYNCDHAEIIGAAGIPGAGQLASGNCYAH